MLVTLHCPHCQNSQQAEIQLPGQTVPCENCGQPLTAFLNQTKDGSQKEDTPSAGQKANAPAEDVEEASASSGIATYKPAYRPKSQTDSANRTANSDYRPRDPRQSLTEPEKESTVPLRDFSAPSTAPRNASGTTTQNEAGGRKELWSDIFWGALLTLGVFAVLTFQPVLPVFSAGLRRVVIDQLANVGFGVLILGVIWILVLAYHRRELFRFIIPFYYFSFVTKYKDVARKPAACISVGMLIVVFSAIARILPMMK